MNKRRYNKNKFKQRLDTLRLHLEAQGLDGVWNSSKYNHGFYNGIEYALAMIEGRQPINTKSDFDSYLPKDEINI